MVEKNVAVVFFLCETFQNETMHNKKQFSICIAVLRCPNGQLWAYLVLNARICESIVKESLDVVEKCELGDALY